MNLEDTFRFSLIVSYKLKVKSIINWLSLIYVNSKAKLFSMKFRLFTYLRASI